MLKEFKEFAMRGNVVELAVAVIIGAAFGNIITAIVDKLFMPIIGMVMGGVDFSNLTVGIGEAQIGYGAVIQAIIDFLVIAFCLFLVIKGIAKVSKKDDVEEVTGPTSEELLEEIRDLMKEQQSK